MTNFSLNFLFCLLRLKSLLQVRQVVSAIFTVSTGLCLQSPRACYNSTPGSSGVTAKDGLKRGPELWKWQQKCRRRKRWERLHRLKLWDLTTNYMWETKGKKESKKNAKVLSVDDGKGKGAIRTNGRNSGLIKNGDPLNILNLRWMWGNKHVKNRRVSRRAGETDAVCTWSAVWVRWPRTEVGQGQIHGI